MNGLFVWDASLGIPETSEERFFIRENLSNHDTSTSNYQTFVAAVKTFESEAEQHYPDMDYQGFYTAKNGIVFEPLPEEILHAFSSLIYETAIHNGLCVYDSLSDSLYTLETADRHYPKGNAKKIWQEQLDEKAMRLQQLENEEYILPKNSREADKLTNKLVRERLKQEGIKNVKRSSGGHNYTSDFGDIQLKFYINVSARSNSLGANVKVYLNIEDYLKENKDINLYLSSIDYLDAYAISDDDIYDYEYMVPVYGKEGNSYHPELLNQEINRAIDLFIDTYKSCQSLEGLYQFYTNDNNDPRLQSRFIDSRVYKPTRKMYLILLAKLTQQTNYEVVKQQLLKEGIEQDTQDLIMRRERHEDKEKYRRQICEKSDIIYVEDPFRGYTGDDPEAYYKKEYLEYIAKVDALDVDDILSMDLPKGLRI